MLVRRVEGGLVECSFPFRFLVFGALFFSFSFSFLLSMHSGATERQASGVSAPGWDSHGHIIRKTRLSRSFEGATSLGQ